MSYNNNHKIRIKDLVSLETHINSKLETSLINDWPESDGNVYVVKNGAFVQASTVAQAYGGNS